MPAYNSAASAAQEHRGFWTILLLNLTMRSLMMYAAGGSVGLVMLESVLRRKAPESLFRPSNLIDLGTTYSRSISRWVGFQFARFTDIYYLIKEFFPYEDIQRLGGSLWRLCISPFQALKGYHDYYTAGMTPLQYGIVSSAIVIGLLGLGLRYYWKPEHSAMIYNVFHGLRKESDQG